MPKTQTSCPEYEAHGTCKNTYKRYLTYTGLGTEIFCAGPGIIYRVAHYILYVEQAHTEGIEGIIGIEPGTFEVIDFAKGKPGVFIPR